jgi:serine/threonine protein kinase
MDLEKPAATYNPNKPPVLSLTRLLNELGSNLALPLPSASNLHTSLALHDTQTPPLETLPDAERLAAGGRPKNDHAAGTAGGAGAGAAAYGATLTVGGFEVPELSKLRLYGSSLPRLPRVTRSGLVSHLAFFNQESLSLSIPYLAPGGKGHHLHADTHDSSSPSATPDTSHIPNLPNGQPILLIHIQSPQVHSSSIDSRFVISKQRIAQAHSHGASALYGSHNGSHRSGSQLGLSLFFSKKQPTAKRDSSSTDLGSFYNNLYLEVPSPTSYAPGGGVASSPSLLLLSESAYLGGAAPLRHNSMANLKRFFKKTPQLQPVTTSNLLSSLRSLGTANSVASSYNGAIPIGPSNGGGALSSLSTLVSNALFSPGGFSGLIGRQSSMKLQYQQERRGSVSGLLSPQPLPFSKRYSKFGENLGAGAGGAVKLVTRLSDKRVFAVKEFRVKYQNESKRDYAKKITGEYCIGLTLKHPNIIETVEICYENERILQVMEYCDFDLFAIVMSNNMLREEINCCFKQILLGIQYMHAMGLAHRDLKLDNCVIDVRGIVKIIDFGLAVVFLYPFNKTLIELQGIVGSDPYLAPEVCVFNKYDPRPVDVWLAAIIYCCMILKKFPWKVPKLSDNSFKLFASRREMVPLSEILKRTPEQQAAADMHNLKLDDISETEVSPPRELPPAPAAADVSDTDGKLHTSTESGPGRLLLAMPEDCRALIGRMVELAPACRITIDECFKDEWLDSVHMCTVEERVQPDGATRFEVLSGGDHIHTQVDQSKAHIAAFDKNKKK